ncbi:UDP-N-acetylmuramoyl-L-alanyl-D-glutamate--2, 6-diaminopimelate ligase [Candidatus Terasakiella magnetica]|uniref:UDP-N-acetylmuramoyl-L-alanyl-D-glutamate--2,6-diaminopimelate ligase n=1 Tax=Candidatus Terasakiella magnetica TaxID=1867952 RepID=A0A1C3RJG3_9PROT|nr:UDP-N-acetylmuramoyl-L-alanyl-D-glutamate--2,6-diaminopimelate ligase [Candidatus Terasakiella magnetica]SCA57415.1 UDP-N-acetylmuramoyl-L-alanyl-D-glutamate--2, 6-diaminopimelate ligase [Candidatus Terasakiella magnetica]
MVMLDNLIPELEENMEITGITVDSRKVKPGFLFAALPGSNVDGRSFIPQAVENGARVVLVNRDDGEMEAIEGVIFVYDKNPRLRFADIAASFYEKQPRMTAAITGTNGKSSCVTFVRQMWSMLGEQAASIGTLGITAPGLDISGGLTTPDPAGLHERLDEIAKLGVTHLAMEASSHGLDQFRMDGVNVRIAAFTNLSRDHLDYHGDMASYLAAKKRLFSELLRPGGKAVLNADAPEFDELVDELDGYSQKVISYGKKGETICLKEATPCPEGQKLSLEIDGETYTLTLPLAGYFQAENALCSLGVVMASGANAADCVPLLEKLEGVPGRMELIGKGVYVDYAHTPDALQTVLKALRPHTDGKLCVVFGCGGDRDRGKRPEMGRIATENADIIYVTDDNPRGEDAASIRAEIMPACPTAHEIGDRKDAISQAIANLNEGDVLLIAGKGHETGQIVGDKVLPFDDRALAKEVING